MRGHFKIGPQCLEKEKSQTLPPFTLYSMTNPQQFSTFVTTSQISLIPSIPLPLPTTLNYPTIYLSFIHLTAPMFQSLVPPMPARGECGAPQFDPAKPCGLRPFFNNLIFQFAQAQVVDEVEMKGHALHFVDYDTTELWEILPEFANTTTPYRRFVDTVCQLYPGSDAEQCWLIADMDRLVEETLRTGISSLTDLGKYHRDFITITTFLIMKNHLTTPKHSHTFTCAFPLELWSQVGY